MSEQPIEFGPAPDPNVVYAHQTFIQHIDWLERPVWVPGCVACGRGYITMDEDDAQRWAVEHDAGAPRNELFADLKPGQTRRLIQTDRGLVLESRTEDGTENSDA